MDGRLKYCNEHGRMNPGFPEPCHVVPLIGCALGMFWRGLVFCGWVLFSGGGGAFLYAAGTIFCWGFCLREGAVPSC